MFEKIKTLPKELYYSRKLILKLSKNDFKTRYAGSYLGIVWAFIQPIVTVLVYWFVFEIGLRSPGVKDFPFVLWLVAGIIPWFFFSDALNGGTNALLEYNYLVKKVVFKISVLPVIKLISAAFVHGFFVCFGIALFAFYGYFPDLYTLQVIYYTGCLFILILGACFATCSVVIFFRDLTQVINIALQVGIWVTPIMWNIEGIGKNHPAIMFILKLNPLYYIVNGYRHSLIDKVWIWEEGWINLYFWGFTLVVFVLGAGIFNKLKVHFADVL